MIFHRFRSRISAKCYYARMHRPRLAGSLLPLAGALAVAIGCLWNPGTLSAQDPDPVERYLQQLGLVDLQILQLNEMINTKPRNRTDRAKRLVNLYVDQLIVDSDDEQRRNRMLRDIKALVKKIPAARSPGLEVMLLVAEQQQAEKNTDTWINDPQDQKSRQDAIDTLKDVIAQLAKHRQVLKGQLKQLELQLDNLEDGKLYKLKETEYDRKNAVARRAGFFLGWSHYYYGILLDNSGASSRHYGDARKQFREFLYLEEDDKLADLTAEDLELDRHINALALMGLAQCHLLLGNGSTADKYFTYFQDAQIVGAADHTESICRHGRTLMIGKQFEAARVFLQGVFAKKILSDRQQLGQCVSMVLFGAGYPNVRGADELANFGLREIVTLGRDDYVAFLVKKYKIDLDQIDGFYFAWIKAKVLLTAAEKKKTKIAYVAAEKALQAAMAKPDANAEDVAVSQCRYQLAFCKYSLDKYEESASEFEKASKGLQKAGDKNAGNSTWMAIASYLKVLKKNPRHVPKIIALLQQFKADFPKHPQVGKVDLLVSKIQRDSLPVAQAVAKLEKITPTAKTYLSARYDICSLLHTEWLRVRNTPGKGPQIGKQLVAAVDTYVKAAGDEYHEKQLTSVLWAVETNLHGTTENLFAARRFLAQASALNKKLPAGGKPSVLNLNIHYHSMQVEQKTKNKQEADKQARWLSTNGRGCNYELPALMQLSKSDKPEARETADHQRDAYQRYSRMVELLGNTEDAIRSTKNTRIVNLRLVSYAIATGAHGEAADVMAKFLAVSPRNVSYLRLAGLANFEAGRFPASLDAWRTLLGGVKKGSGEWHEAKYYLIACLAKTDRAKAKAVYKNFRVYYTKPPSPWNRKYIQLNL